MAAGVAALMLTGWINTAGRSPVSNSSGSSNSSAVTSTQRIVTYEVVGGAKSATITYQAPTGTAQASIKVPLVNKSGDMVTFEMDRGDFVYISAQNKGTSGNIICRISVDGKVISTVTSSGAYAIASCDGSVP
ncbi:MmpS family transport accessory protein [Pseudarthrobacter sp. MDT1-22]